MSEPSTTSSQLALFAEAFPVSRTRLLVDAADLPMSAISGPNLSDSFAVLNLDGSWRKTCQGYSQVTLDGSLERFSETWPRAGITRNGTAYRQAPLAPITDGTECGLWRTPSATEANGGGVPGDRHLAAGHSMRLRDQIKAPSLWPTPTSRDHKDGTTPRIRFQQPQADTLGRAVQFSPTLENSDDLPITGSLNPTWVEWLMGYPLGWTACVAWATRSSRKSRNGLRAESSTTSA